MRFNVRNSLAGYGGIPFLLTLVAGVGVAAGPANPPTADIASSHLRALIRLVRQLRPTAPDPRTTLSPAGAIGVVCSERLDRLVRLRPGAGAPPLQWDKGPPSAPSEQPAGGDEPGVPCSAMVYRRFLAGDDAFSFTVGRAEETCNDAPRLILSTRGVRPESVRDSDRIACWRVGTNEWYWTPERGALLHRPGFDLAALLPDWRTASVSEAGEALVLRGRERALVVWPGQRAWLIEDAATGAAIPAAHQDVNRRIIPGEQVRLTSRLRELIQAEFRERNRGFDPFEVLELVTEPCRARLEGGALLARAVVHGAEERGVRDPVTGGWRWSDETFGVFVVDSALTRLRATLGMFPTGRWLDYTAYFDLEAPDDSVVVWGEGATYGEDPRRMSYPCSP